MFHKIKLWWYTSILKKVVYKPDGKPYDCHGLRYEGRLPFGKETRYSITNEYIGCIYKGNGCYYYEDGLLLTTLFTVDTPIVKSISEGSKSNTKLLNFLLLVSLPNLNTL